MFSLLNKIKFALEMYRSLLSMNEIMKIYPYNKDSENYSSFYSYFAEKGSKINKQEGIIGDV